MAQPNKTLEDQLRDANEIIRSKNRELIAVRREVNRRSVEQESAEKVRSAIFGIAEYSPEPPEWLTQEPGKSSSGIPIVQLNDWHWGETVDPDQVGGVNKFNRTIARQRVHTLFNTVNDLCFNHMTNPSYPGIVVTILGDMITGCIHDDLSMTNDGPLTISLVEVENHIIALLEGWADKFGNVAAICVPGNHGRNTIKPRNNNKVYESYEWLVYCHIEKHFRNKAKNGDKRVTVYVPNEVDAHFTVFGHRFMATHGDTLGVKGGDGFIGALGPITRGTLKVGAQQRSAGKDFDTLIIGHFHIYVPRGDAAPVLVSPSLIGHSMYAHLQLRVRASRPAQALSFVHHKHGFTAQWPMYLDKKPQASKNSPWFAWTGGRTNIDLELDA
jgi:hypothetical protein